MGIFGAMITAVAGLRAQSYALENISGNIANSQTTGFKRVDTSFEDLVPSLPVRQQASGSVSAFSRGTNTIDGPLNATGVGTNIALSGEGYIVVRDRADYVGGLPTFSATNFYTRRGDFEVDKNGFLVNGAGNYLVGYQVDPLTDSVTGGAPDVLRFTNDQVPARATTTIVYRANLPAKPTTANSDPAVPNSELITGTALPSTRAPRRARCRLARRPRSSTRRSPAAASRCSTRSATPSPRSCGGASPTAWPMAARTPGSCST